MVAARLAGPAPRRAWALGGAWAEVVGVGGGMPVWARGLGRGGADGVVVRVNRTKVQEVTPATPARMSLQPRPGVVALLRAGVTWGRFPKLYKRAPPSFIAGMERWAFSPDGGVLPSPCTKEEEQREEKAKRRSEEGGGREDEGVGGGEGEGGNVRRAMEKEDGNS